MLVVLGFTDFNVSFGQCCRWLDECGVETLEIVFISLIPTVQSCQSVMEVLILKRTSNDKETRVETDY